MNPTTKTILIISSVIALGGVAYLIFKKAPPTPSNDNVDEKETKATPTPIDQSLKGVDLTKGGTHLPTLKEFQDWRKANPIKLDMPSLSTMMKGTNWLKIGEQVPQTTTSKIYSKEYGVNVDALKKYDKYK